jgi:Fe-S cluster biogenesis protein NfuA
MLDIVEDVIEKDIRPQLQRDGGDIEIVGLRDNVLTLRLRGQCCTCPLSSQTIGGFIKRVLNERINGLKDVVVESGLSEEMLDVARKFLRGEQ